MDDELKSRLSAGDTWLRLLFVILFGFFATVAILLIWLVAAGQFFFLVFSGRTNGNLSEFADTLVAYVVQAFSYMVYRTDSKPFPFAPPPKGVLVQEVANAAAESTSRERGQHEDGNATEDGAETRSS